MGPVIDSAIAQLRNAVPRFAEFQHDECLVAGVEMMLTRAARQLQGHEPLLVRVSNAAGTAITAVAALVVVLARNGERPVPQAPQPEVL